MQQTLNSHFPVTDGAQSAFEKQFNRKPFLLAHRIHTHELFTIRAFQKLAERLARSRTPRGFFNLAGASRELQWGTPAFQAAVSESFERIDRSKMRLKLSSIHIEPEYREVFDAFCRELDGLSDGRLLRDFHQPLATVFISSPGEVTPYHVDSEVNFLLQLSGTKTVYIFDGRDRELVNDRTLEQYWGKGSITLEERHRSRGVPFELEPGLGVHNPVHFPHWVQNGPAPSVSLSLGFLLREEPSDVLRVNYHLRKFGLSPVPPGENPRVDSAKRSLVQGVRTLRKALRGSRGPNIKIR